MFFIYSRQEKTDTLKKCLAEIKEKIVENQNQADFYEKNIELVRKRSLILNLNITYSFVFILHKKRLIKEVGNPRKNLLDKLGAKINQVYAECGFDSINSNSANDSLDVCLRLTIYVENNLHSISTLFLRF